MTFSAEKIPADYVDEMTRRERVVAWFIRRGSRSWIRRVRWHRVAGVVAAMGVIGYTATAGAVYGFVRYVNGVEKAEFLDILLPHRWDNYRVARGDKQIAEAKMLGDEGKFMEAFLYARIGVASSPANREGRLMLVDLLLAVHRTKDARQTLMEGLQYHSKDPIYLKPVLSFLLQRQEDAKVVALAHRYLPEVAPNSGAEHLLALAAATACSYRGNYDQAEDFIRAVPLFSASRDGRLLAAKLEGDRGYHELALLQLRLLARELPQDGEVHRELVGRLRAYGQWDEARRNSLAFQIAFPARPEPRIELLYAYTAAADPVRVASEASALLRDFATDQSALLALAEFASERGDVVLMQRIVNQAAKNGLELGAFAMLSVETLVVARNYQGALDAIRAYTIDFPGWEQRYRDLLDSLSAAALLGKGDAVAAAFHIDKFLGQGGLRVANLLALANRLEAIGSGGQARKVLIRAVEVDPLDQGALARLLELEIKQNETADLAVYVQRFVRMRRPSPDILKSIQEKLGSDRELFSRDCSNALYAINESLQRLKEADRKK